ncbi:MAG: hypothetical protein Q7T16_04280 [Candidatus Burarchaeum sp.]|nr:hypothetical protein [Candidatus Burarchaeum sp.]MDO8339847.1 hypothetical protein [Candidatus Burarchaeum sp.]
MHLRKFLEDPHLILWVLLGLFILAASYGNFTDVLKQTITISIVYVMIYFSDNLLFDMHGKSPVTVFSDNRFTARWRTFPLFILELIILSLLATYATQQLTINLSPSSFTSLFILMWLSGLLMFYYFIFCKQK